MEQVFTLTVAADAPAGQRLDVWLLAQLGTADFSRAGIQKLVKNHHVKRNGAAEANPARKVRPGEVYTVTIPPAETYTLQPEPIPLKILYEDNDLVVINKPAGMAVHPSLGHSRGTLVHALLNHCKGGLSGINGEARPGIVHRLDKDTSGILVAAKNDKSHRGLAGQFARHTIHRAYLALVKGTPTPAAGKITGAIGRHPADRKQRAVLASGKHAVTHYKTIEKLAGAALVECRLETGRTHQIRVHMAHIGHPLLGDPMYGRALTTNSPLKPALENFKRQALHAAELGFTHPTTNRPMSFSSPLPADMQALLEALRKNH